MKQLLNIFSIDYYTKFFKKIRLFFETNFFDILNGTDTSRVSKPELFGENSDFEHCNLHVPTFTSRIKLALKTLIKLHLTMNCTRCLKSCKLKSRNVYQTSLNFFYAMFEHALHS